MGVVYRARHVALSRAVAVKTVRLRSPRSLDSMRREIQSLTRIRHPGIVRILDHGVQDGIPWYAMDLLEGETLRNFSGRIWSAFRSLSVPRARPTDLFLDPTDDLLTFSSETSSDLPVRVAVASHPGDARAGAGAASPSAPKTPRLRP
jgi:serine/threonine protein kinase